MRILSSPPHHPQNERIELASVLDRWDMSAMYCHHIWKRESSEGTLNQSEC